MVRTKEAASKSRVIHDFEPDSSIPSEKEEGQMKDEPIGSKASTGRTTNSEEDELLPLPKERAANQPAITSFFKRTPVKQTDKDTREQDKFEPAKADTVEEEISAEEDHTPLVTRRTAIGKEKKAQQDEEQLKQKESFVSTEQRIVKGKEAKKLPLRKSTRGSLLREPISPRSGEAEELEQSPVKQKKSSEKGKRKLEEIKQSKELGSQTTQEKAVKKQADRADELRLKGIKITDVSNEQQNQNEEVINSESISKKKQKVTKSEQQKVSMSPSTATRSRMKKVEESSTPAPAEKSKQKGHEEKDKEVQKQEIKQISPRRKMIARKTKPTRVLPTTSDNFPFISAEAKKKFESVLKFKPIIKERALNWNTPNAAPEVKAVIQQLKWEELCAKPGEAVVALVKEFYANFQNEEDEKIFVRGKWVEISSRAINKALNTQDFETDDYFEKSVKGISAKELEQVLCQPNKKIKWTQGKSRKRNFHTDALKSHWMPLFKLICSRLLPTTHKSDITMDRAILLYAMVKNLKIDVGSLIKNSMSKTKMPSKALWYPALVTKLCLNAEVVVEKDELKIKPGQAISADVFDDKTQFGGHKVAHEILKQLKEIKENQERLLAFAKFQQEWNQSMLTMCTTSAKSPIFNKSVFAGKPTGGEGTSQAPVEMEKEETSGSEEEEDEDEVWREEDVAMDFDEELRGKFTTEANQTESEEENSSAN